MRITYVGYGDFHRYAGMKQMYHFAQEVCRQGHHAQLLIAGSARTVEAMDEPPLAEIVEMRFIGPFLHPHVWRRVTAFRPDILHVWTPRFVPALAGLQLHWLTKAVLIVDHEDDEEYHVQYARNAFRKRWGHGVRRLLAPLVAARNGVWPWVSPLRSDGSARRGYREAITSSALMRCARAHTAISPNLEARVRQSHPETPVYLLYPGTDLDRFGPHVDAASIRAELGLDGTEVLLYSGTMDVKVFAWFLDVLEHVAVRHPRALLVLVGEDRFRSTAQHIAEARGLQSRYRLIGQQPYTKVPSYLAAADVLIQHPLDLGNELRLPAKLPEYLAAGKPIVTYAQGIGEILLDRTHVRKLYTTEPLEAAAAICDLLDSPAERSQLAREARRLACERFDWRTNGPHLVSIYQAVLSDMHKDISC